MSSAADKRQKLKPDSSPGLAPAAPISLKRRLKQLTALLIIAGSFIFLVYYWRSHPEIASQLKTVSPWSIVAIMGLYLVMTLVLVGVYDTILRLCAKPIPLGEHTLLTAYSSIINFFGPLQSGPGFRTIYLKQKHGVSAKSYLTGTLLYYALFGVINLVFLAIAFLAPSYIPLLLAGLAGGWLLVSRLTRHIGWLRRFGPAVHNPLTARLGLLTLAQASLVIVIYYIELHAIGSNASLLQAVAYAGAGSLALFVSLTPGALGFRESFQYFTQSIHGLDNTTIIAANVLDRSAYVVFLIIMFLAIVAFHAKSKLQLKR